MDVRTHPGLTEEQVRRWRRRREEEEKKRRKRRKEEEEEEKRRRRKRENGKKKLTCPQRKGCDLQDIQSPPWFVEPLRLVSDELLRKYVLTSHIVFCPYMNIGCLT